MPNKEISKKLSFISKNQALDIVFAFAIIKLLISLRSGSQGHDRSFVL